MLNYIIDTYLSVAASALSANVVVRSSFGAAFPVRIRPHIHVHAPAYSPLQLFARQMYIAMNPRWASTLLGCVTLLFTPIPFIFMRYGPALRARSRYSQAAL